MNEEAVRCIVFNGPPNGNVIAPVGAVCLDASPDGATWIKTEGADAYGWEKTASGWNEAGTVTGFDCGPARHYRRSYADCEVCDRSTAQAHRWDGLAHGITEVCLHCGTEWQDGIALAKPDPAMARRSWDEAELAAKFDAWVREQERPYSDEESTA